MRSRRARDGSWRGSRWERGRTSSVCGRSRAAIRSATPTTCVERLRRPLAAAATLTLLLAGCGGHGRTQSTLPQRGRAVFAAACAGCHTLTGHDTHAPGAALAIASRSPSEIASFVRVMPVRLSRAEVDAVAAYVHAAPRRRH